jgi:hypothetical protein
VKIDIVSMSARAQKAPAGEGQTKTIALCVILVHYTSIA